MSKEFCAGAQILLKRMESDPEEFNDTGIWSRLAGDLLVYGRKNADLNTSVSSYVNCLTELEIDALLAGLTKIKRVEFDKWVMERVLRANEPDTEAKLSYAYAANLSKSMLSAKQIASESLDLLRGQLSLQGEVQTR